MVHRPRAWLASAATGLLAASCAGSGAAVAPDLPSRGLPLGEQTLTPGQTARRVATVPTSTEGEPVAVPATARAGEPVAIGVTTYGGGCIREDTTVATVAGLRADVVPYQLIYTPRANEACTLELRTTTRAVRVTFAAPGTAQVVVTGRAGGDSLSRIVRTIEVR